MRRRGSNVIEFAMIMPVFVLGSWGLIEFSWLSFQQGAVAEAVQRGCRDAALIDPGRAEVNANVVTEAARTGVLTQFDGGGCESCSAAASLVGEVPQRALQCTLDVDYSGLTSLFPTMSALTSSQTVRLEYQRRTE